MKNHYYETKLIKMGTWPLSPLDCDTWHTEDGSKYFKRTFGFFKGLLIINTEDGGEHAYIPESFLKKLYAYIEETAKKDFKALEKKLKKFYILKERAKKAIPKINPKDLGRISNKELIKRYKKNRDWAHLITVYDQFGWLGEEYWTPLMKKILIERLGLEEGNRAYHKTLFTLTKPEKISTTLEEKRAVLKEAIAVKNKTQSLLNGALKLAKAFGFMPVFTYGDPWDKEWYATHLKEIASQKRDALEKEYEVLKKYSVFRNRDIKQIVKKYKISKEDLQIFIDFGLALDARNEAEYIVSFASFYLLPIYKEIAERLRLTVAELRMFYEKEVEEALEGKIDYKNLLVEKRTIKGYGFDESMKKRIFFSSGEAKKLFTFLESGATFLQGNSEHKGICASSGKARGIARIISSPKDNGKINEGEIMITSATTVDYLPAMKKAAAIVTEVGGLTCHAAVVSREFGIPCVVALKNAMKNIKDGDTLEIYADRGLVTVLKKTDTKS